MDDLKQQYLDELKHLSNLKYRDEIKIVELIENFNGMSIEIRKKEKLLQLEQWAYLSTHPSKHFDSFCYNDDDDEDYTSAITPDEPVLSTEEPDNSLSMGDEHLDTILAMKSNEFIKSSVENLIPIPSESEGIPEYKCDVPFHDNSLPLDVSQDQFEDFSESNDEFSSTDDDSFSIDKINYVEASPLDSELVSSEVIEIVIPKVGWIHDDILLTIKDDILRENLLNVNHLFFKIEASNDNPIPFYDLIISRTPLTLTPSGEKGDILLLEAFLNDDHSSDFKTKSSSTCLNSLLEETNNFDNSLPKFTTFLNVLFDVEYESDSSDDQSCSDEDVLEKIIDSLLDEFAGELTLLKSIPPGIDGTDCDFEEDICLIEKLLYDNSYPRPPKEFVSVNSDAVIESFSPSPILVKDSDSLMEEIDLSFTPDYPMPPGIEDDDYDSERDILILKDLPSNDTLLIPEKESFHFDIPPFSRPPAKPPYENFNGMSIEIRKKEKLLQLEQWAYLSTHPSKHFDSFCYNDDDDEDYTSAITPDEPVLSTEEPDNSLSMGDEHLDTISAMKSDEFIKSSVENLIPIPSESEGIPEYKCDVPFYDNSPPLDVSQDQFEDFFESNDEFSLTGDDSFSIDKIDYAEASPLDSELVSSEVIEIVIPEVGGIDDDILLTIKDDILRENLLNVNHLFAKIEASNDNPIPFYDLIISGTPLTLTPSGESDFFIKFDAFLAETNNFDNSLPKFTTFLNVLFDVEYESDSSNDQSCSDEDVLEKIVSKPLFEEEIIPIKIDLHSDNAESDLMESLCTHDSSLLILFKINSLLDEFAEFVFANSDAVIESFSPSPILVKDSDSLMEEIDLSFTPDYPMPPGVEDDDYDSERDILILKDLPSNDTLSIPEKESFHFDIPPFSRPPAKPPYGNTGILNIKMMSDISDQKAFMHKLMITFAPHQKKSPDLLSHRGLKAF
nr:hypothetical protein [Tanacetum cinerariifolium]